MTTHINNNTSLPANNNGVTEDKGKDKVKVTGKKYLSYRVVKKKYLLYMLFVVQFSVFFSPPD